MASSVRRPSGRAGPEQAFVVHGQMRPPDARLRSSVPSKSLAVVPGEDMEVDFRVLIHQKGKIVPIGRKQRVEAKGNSADLPVQIGPFVEPDVGD